MVSKVFLLSVAVAYVEARFGQEQIPIGAIGKVQGGNPGQAQTIAGGAVSNLLGAANACDKLTTADNIISSLGTGADAVAAAIGMVTAEKNTNPFANNNTQNVCGDPTLPKSAQLRGITPLIDPAVDTTGAVAALSKQSAGAPLQADGLSVFDLLSQAGFGNLVASQQPAGGAGAQAAGGNANGNTNANQNGNANQAAGNANQNANQAAESAGQNSTQAAGGNANQNGKKGKKNGNKNGNANANANKNGNANANQAAGNACAAGNANQASGNANQASGNANQQASGNANQASGNANQAAGNATAASGASGATAGASALKGGEDFGKCTPTMIFEGGQGGRPATEFTFQIADPVARGGQQEALNPNIITNALCNQLTNVCAANAAAVSACQDAKAQVAAAGTRDKSTADLFNAALGFAGAVTNPDGGPANPAATAKAAGRMMRRGLRL